MSGQMAASRSAAEDPVEMVVQVGAWKAIPWLRHGFSTRLGGVSTVYLPGSAGGGDLNLGWTNDDDPANVSANRRRLVDAITGTETTPLVTIRQIHEAMTLPVPAMAHAAGFTDAQGRATREADGLMTAAPGLLLGVQTADCVPVLVADTRNRAVAAFHAGWRGTAARIVEQGIARMAGEYGSRPEDLIAAVGPSIGSCCYSVGEQVYAAFTSNFSYGEALFRRGREIPDPVLYLDLWEANRRQLLASGVSPGAISILAECTGCTGLPGGRRYFSHRYEHGFTGRMMNVIGIALP